MTMGRWMLALLGALAMCLVTTGSAAAMEARERPKPPKPAMPPCLCGPDDGADAAKSAPEGDEAADDDAEDAAPRAAVPGRVPARVRERLMSARRALRAAEQAASAGREARAAAHVAQARRHLSKAHDAALARAEDELPGGVAAVRAVTAVQHGGILRATALVVEADGALYGASLKALNLVAGERDEAARLLLETEGTDAEVEAIGEHVEEELGTLEEILANEDADEDLVDDLSDVAETISGTAGALGLELREEEEEE